MSQFFLSTPVLLSKLARAIGCSVLIASLPTVAHALPFSYSESISGDLTSAPTTGFVFDYGNNTISGTTHFGVNVPGHQHYDSDFDGFAFTLPSQLRLIGISLQFITNAYNTSKANYELRFCRGINCDAGLVNLLGTETVNFLDQPSPSIDFGGPLPGDSGTYSVITSGLGIGPLDPANVQESWSVDYMWTCTVVSVPEPEAPLVLALFGLGVASLFTVRRVARKQAR